MIDKQPVKFLVNNVGFILVGLIAFALLAGLKNWAIIFCGGLFLISIFLISIRVIWTTFLVPIFSKSARNDLRKIPTFTTLILMIGLGLPIGILVGVLGYSLSSLLAWAFGGLVFRLDGLWGYVIVVIAGILIGVATPIVLGSIIGDATSLLGTMVKCQNLSWINLIGFLNRAGGYAAFLYAAIRASGTPQLSSGIFFSSFNPWGIYYFIGMDALLFMAGRWEPFLRMENLVLSKQRQILISAVGIVLVVIAANSETGVLRPSWSRVCSGAPALQSNVAVSQNPKMWFGGYFLAVPDEIRASNLKDFHYAICLEERTEAVKTCSYTGGSERTLEQVLWDVKVRDTQTAKVLNQRTFSGVKPTDCPETVASTAGIPKGPRPSSNEVINWLKSILH